MYADLGDYNVLQLQSPYSPERYIEAIKTCEDAGMELIIIDSITHEWDGKGGCLDIHSDLGGQFAHWAKVTPRHNAFIQSILQSKFFHVVYHCLCHFFVLALFFLYIFKYSAFSAARYDMDIDFPGLTKPPAPANCLIE